MAEPAGRVHQIDPDADPSASHAAWQRTRDESPGVGIIDQARGAEPGSPDERALARHLEQLEDLHEGVVALTGLVSSIPAAGRAAKWLGGVLAVAIAASPVLGALVPDADANSRLESIEAHLETSEAHLEQAQDERRGLAVYLWQLDQCRTDPAKCPTQPPATVRLMLAQDELDL
jgi:hypothetical protein